MLPEDMQPGRGEKSYQSPNDGKAGACVLSRY